MFGLRASDLPAVLYLAQLQIRRRYAGSAIGLAWSLLVPASQIAALTFVFGYVLRMPMENYALHMASGLLPWLFLVGAIQTGASSYVSRREAVIHSAIPPACFVVADVLAEFALLLAALAVLLPVAVLTNGSVGWIVLVPLALVPSLLAGLACALIAARLTIYLRDVPHLLGVAFGLLFWFTPIVYHWSFLPERLESLVKYNPFALLISLNQVVWSGAGTPSLALSGAALAIAALACALERVSRGLERRAAYWL